MFNFNDWIHTFSLCKTVKAIIDKAILSLGYPARTAEAWRARQHHHTRRQWPHTSSAILAQIQKETLDKCKITQNQSVLVLFQLWFPMGPLLDIFAVILIGKEIKWIWQYWYCWRTEAMASAFVTGSLFPIRKALIILPGAFFQRTKFPSLSYNRICHLKTPYQMFLSSIRKEVYNVR